MRMRQTDKSCQSFWPACAEEVWPDFWGRGKNQEKGIKQGINEIELNSTGPVLITLDFPRAEKIENCQVHPNKKFQKILSAL